MIRARSIVAVLALVAVAQPAPAHAAAGLVYVELTATYPTYVGTQTANWVGSVSTNDVTSSWWAYATMTSTYTIPVSGCPLIESGSGHITYGAGANFGDMSWERIGATARVIVSGPTTGDGVLTYTTNVVGDPCGAPNVVVTMKGYLETR